MGVQQQWTLHDNQALLHHTHMQQAAPAGSTASTVAAATRAAATATMPSATRTATTCNDKTDNWGKEAQYATPTSNRRTSQTHGKTTKLSTQPAHTWWKLKQPHAHHSQSTTTWMAWLPSMCTPSNSLSGWSKLASPSEFQKCQMNPVIDMTRNFPQTISKMWSITVQVPGFQWIPWQWSGSRLSKGKLHKVVLVCKALIVKHLQELWAGVVVPGLPPMGKRVSTRLKAAYFTRTGILDRATQNAKWQNHSE